MSSSRAAPNRGGRPRVKPLYVARAGPGADLPVDFSVHILPTGEVNEQALPPTKKRNLGPSDLTAEYDTFAFGLEAPGADWGGGDAALHEFGMAQTLVDGDGEEYGAREEEYSETGEGDTSKRKRYTSSVRRYTFISREK